MTWKDSPNRGPILAFTWRDWENHATSIGTMSAPAEIRTVQTSYQMGNGGTFPGELLLLLLLITVVGEVAGSCGKGNELSGEVAFTSRRVERLLGSHDSAPWNQLKVAPVAALSYLATQDWPKWRHPASFLPILAARAIIRTQALT
jgi:hypothetical protein